MYNKHNNYSKYSYLRMILQFSYPLDDLEKIDSCGFASEATQCLYSNDNYRRVNFNN